MKRFAPNIAIFCVSLILLSKVVDLHVLSHLTDDTELQHCEICVLTIAINVLPLVEAEVVTSPTPKYDLLEQKLNTTIASVVYHNQHLSTFLFTRPPPTLV